jgi:hypothetical protein
VRTAAIVQLASSPRRGARLRSPPRRAADNRLRKEPLEHRFLKFQFRASEREPRLPRTGRKGLRRMPVLVRLDRSRQRPVGLRESRAPGHEQAVALGSVASGADVDDISKRLLATTRERINVVDMGCRIVAVGLRCRSGRTDQAGLDDGRSRHLHQSDNPKLGRAGEVGPSIKESAYPKVAST